MTTDITSDSIAKHVMDHMPEGATLSKEGTEALNNCPDGVCKATRDLLNGIPDKKRSR